MILILALLMKFFSNSVKKKNLIKNTIQIYQQICKQLLKNKKYYSKINNSVYLNKYGIVKAIKYIAHLNQSRT